MEETYFLSPLHTQREHTIKVLQTSVSVSQKLSSSSSQEGNYLKPFPMTHLANKKEQEIQHLIIKLQLRLCSHHSKYFVHL